MIEFFANANVLSFIDIIFFLVNYNFNSQMSFDFKKLKAKLLKNKLKNEKRKMMTMK